MPSRLEERPKEDPMSKRILLVDDTDTVLLFEKMILRGSGIELRTAKNGLIALEEVAKEHPDLILLDIMMPELNGIEVCQKLKADPDTKEIPIIMVTTKGEPKMVEQAFRAGCDDYITKPLDKVELLSKVNTYLA
jgi:CheY-like chemotaxis protein